MIKQKMIFAHLYAAEAYSKASYAKRLQVGAVIVNQLTDQPVSLGWNGMPASEPNVCEVEIDGVLVSKPDVIHAEINAIIRIPAKLRRDYLTLFCTDSPCPACAREIVSSGIRQVIFSRRYRLDEGIVYLLKHDVEVYDGLSRFILVEGKVEKVEMPFDKDGYLQCWNYLKRIKTKPYGLRTQKQGWTCTSQAGILSMFDGGYTVTEIAERYDRSYGSICGYLQRMSRLSWSEHYGFMKTVRPRFREIWCSNIDLDNNNHVIQKELQKVAPEIISETKNGASEEEIIKMFDHISPCYIREIMLSSIS